jgi:hypothetical protein
MPIAGGNSVSIIPRSLFAMSEEQIKRIKLLSQMYASSIFHSDKSKLKEADYFLLMLKGAELGISPMAAIDFINVIGQEMCLSGQGMMALIYASGLLEDIKIDSTDQRCSVTMKRQGMVAHTEVFGIDEATRMKTTTWENGTKKTISLMEKDNYRQQPRTMFKWRAIANCAKAVFADVIGGMYTAEEVAAAKGLDIIVEDNGKMMIAPSPAAPLARTVLDKPAPPPQEQPTTVPTSEAPKTEDNTPKWLTSDNQKKLVARAIGDGYLLQKQGWADLVKLANADPVKYPTGQEFYKRVMAAAEELKKAKNLTQWEVIVEECVYDGKTIIFETNHGLLTWFKGRKELAKLVGQDFAAEWNIEQWHGTEDQPETYDFSGLKLVYHRNKNGHLELLSAEPVRLEPDYTEAELAAIAASAATDEVDPNDLEAFFNQDQAKA